MIAVYTEEKGTSQGTMGVSDGKRKLWTPNPNVKQFNPEKDDPLSVTNMWCSAKASQWDVRAKDYLNNDAKPKDASKSAAFELVGLSIVTSLKPLRNLADHIKSLKAYLEEDAESDDPGFFVICAYLLPGHPTSAAVQVFRRVLPEGEDAAFDNAFSRFVKGDDEYRNDHLKQLAQLENMSWILRSALSGLGGLRPVIIGRRLSTFHYTGPNYIEFDLDVASSSVASMLRGLIVRSAASLLIDVGWLIEGQEADELPERLMCGIRWLNINWDQSVVHLDNDGNQLSASDAGNRNIVEDESPPSNEDDGGVVDAM